MNKRVQIPQNVVKQYEWILKTYESQGVSLADGFQKDGIQNAAGARKVDNWKNWTCSMRIVKNTKGQFLIIEDSGTHGLNGQNLPVAEIQKRTDAEETFSTEMRLARFSSMYNSGGNQMGGGLFGVGKSIYSVASDNYEYYFDSLRDDGIYIANSNFRGSLLPQAYENTKAKKYILDETGFSPLVKTGTRIIIKTPKKELVEAIETKGIILPIQQTWWRIIERMDNSSAIIINGQKVELPKFPLAKNSYKLPNVDNYKTDYRVKNMGVYILENENEDWNGFYYYRKGMRIGQISLSDVPKNLQNKIWGYIEVDQLWEDELAKIEDSIHYGIQKNKKISIPYVNLKNYVNEKFRNLMLEWGYIKDRENEDKKLKEELQKIAEEVQDLFESLKFDDLGKGPKKPDYDIRWRDIMYPIKNSEQVTTGDIIKFGFRIKNGYASKKAFKYSIKTINCFDESVVSIIEQDSAQIDSQKNQDFHYSLNIDSTTAARLQKNIIELRVSVAGSKEKVSWLPFYYDINEPEGKKEILLTLHNCIFPLEGSLRVNPNEQLNEVIYKIDNRKNEELKYKLNISVHNAVDGATKIFDVTSVDGKIAPFETDEIIIGVVKFEKSILDKYIPQGLTELRARLICAEDCSEYQKGDKITTFIQKVYYNCDEKSGKADSFDVQTVKEADQKWRSKLNSRIIYLNVAHPAYLYFEDNAEMQRAYLKEQVLKQYTLLYLKEGKYTMFAKDFEELDIATANDRIMERIEQIYYDSLKV